MTTEKTYYASATTMTAVSEIPEWVLDGLSTDPLEMCVVVRGLVTSPGILKKGYDREVPNERKNDMHIRRVAQMIDTILRMNPNPLKEARPIEQQFVGCCRHFATLATSLLRYRGIPARVRAGFAGYFQPGIYVDHWIIEFQTKSDHSWIRIDPELGDDWFRSNAIEKTPFDLARHGFLSGGEAWQLFRRGDVDSDRLQSGGGKFLGVGLHEVRLDLAALNKVEVLPWDAWGGHMGSSNGKQDGFIDHVAAVTVDGDLDQIRKLYELPNLKAPAELLA